MKQSTMQTFQETNFKFLTKMVLIIPDQLQIDLRETQSTVHHSIISQHGPKLPLILSIQSIWMHRSLYQTQCQLMEEVITKLTTMLTCQETNFKLPNKTELMTWDQLQTDLKETQSMLHHLISSQLGLKLLLTPFTQNIWMLKYLCQTQFQSMEAVITKPTTMPISQETNSRLPNRMVPMMSDQHPIDSKETQNTVHHLTTSQLGPRLLLTPSIQNIWMHRSLNQTQSQSTVQATTRPTTTPTSQVTNSKLPNKTEQMTWDQHQTDSKETQSTAPHSTTSQHGHKQPLIPSIQSIRTEA